MMTTQEFGQLSTRVREKLVALARRFTQTAGIGDEPEDIVQEALVTLWELSEKGDPIQNAEALAAFLNRTQPAAIVNFSMFLHRRSSIYTDIQNGIFTPADEVENMREQRRLLELLELDSCDFDGMHDMLEVRVRGHLPRDREKMLKKNDEAIAQYEHQEPVIALVR